MVLFAPLIIAPGVDGVDIVPFKLAKYDSADETTLLAGRRLCSLVDNTGRVNVELPPLFKDGGDKGRYKDGIGEVQDDEIGEHGVNEPEFCWLLLWLLLSILDGILVNVPIFEDGNDALRPHNATERLFGL